MLLKQILASAGQWSFSLRRGKSCCAALGGEALDSTLSSTALADSALGWERLSSGWAEAALAHQPALLSMAGHSHEAHDAAFGMAQQLESLVSTQLTGAAPGASCSTQQL